MEPTTVTIDDFFDRLKQRTQETDEVADQETRLDPEREARKVQIEQFATVARRYAKRLNREYSAKAKVGLAETAVIIVLKAIAGRPYFTVRQGILPTCLGCRIGNDNEYRDRIGSELIMRSDFDSARYETILQEFLHAVLLGDETILEGFGPSRTATRAAI